MRRIAVILQPGVRAADLAGLVDFFAAAERARPAGDGYEVVLVAPSRAPVRAANGLRIVPDLSFADANGPFAAVVLPAVDESSTAAMDDGLAAWLDRVRRPAAIGSIRAPGDLSGPLAERVGAHVAAHLREPWSVGRLAAVCGMSARHFARVFRLETGLTPRVFVETVRIERARELLSGSQLPLKAIAFECGIRSPNRLRLAFARRHGVSPSAYRANWEAMVKRVQQPATIPDCMAASSTPRPAN